MPDLEEKGVCCSIRMALIPHFAFFALLLLPYHCEAKAENCSETQCLLLPIGDDPVASEFHFKASEKGVRLVYMNLVIGNASYDPLELPDEFLPHRWVWANTIHEPMLALPDDYDILSAGLLNYQVRSMDVKLKDQPSGCLAKLKSTCQNLAVGRLLLQNVTSSSSGDLLHKKTPVVCVAAINTTRTDDPSAQDMWYHHCCDMHKEARTEPAAIRCDQRVHVGYWVKIVNMIFRFLSFFLALFAPALPLALPDYVISLKDEVDKENRSAEQTNAETTRCQGMPNPAAEGEQDNQRCIGPDGGNTEDVALHTVTTNNTLTVTDTTTTTTTATAATTATTAAANRVGNSGEREEESEFEFIPIDDSIPMNLSTLLRESVKKFPDIPSSFNIKLAVLCLGVYPCFLYVQAGLYYTLKKASFDEIIKKHVLVGSVFSDQLLFVNPKVNDGFWASEIFLVTILMIITIIILVLLSRPKDFIFDEDEKCLLCRRFTSLGYCSLNFSLTSQGSVGDDIHRHLKLLNHYVWCFPVNYRKVVVSMYYRLSLGCLGEEMHQESRVSHLCYVFLRLILLIVALPFMVVGGVLCLLIFIWFLIFLLLSLSPAVTVSQFIAIKVKFMRRTQGVRVFCGVLFFLYLAIVGVQLLVILLTNSFLFVSSVVAFIIIGLALNVIIVTPFLAFLLVLTTNVYLCYAKMQGKYREVKKMISTRLQELKLKSNISKDTIREDLYWSVCDKVLPIKSEMCRMLRNMVLVIAFLFSALFSIVFFGNEYDISTLTTTISVFFTGVIPPLFFKVLTTNDNIIGWAKIKMKREIHEVVTEYIERNNLRPPLQQTADTQA